MAVKLSLRFENGALNGSKQDNFCHFHEQFIQ